MKAATAQKLMENQVETDRKKRIDRLAYVVKQRLKFEKEEKVIKDCLKKDLGKGIHFGFTHFVIIDENSRSGWDDDALKTKLPDWQSYRVSINYLTVEPKKITKVTGR